MSTKIEACGCGKRFAFLRHERTGRPAPITQSANGFGNIVGLDETHEPTLVLVDAVEYRILDKATLAAMRAAPGGAELALFVNHFADKCPLAPHFKRE